MGEPTTWRGFDVEWLDERIARDRAAAGLPPETTDEELAQAGALMASLDRQRMASCPRCSRRFFDPDDFAEHMQAHEAVDAFEGSR